MTRRVRTGLFGVATGLLLVCGLAIVIMGPTDSFGWLRYGLPYRTDSGLEVGDPAPDLLLSGMDGNRFRLKERMSERPLVVVFGSYTSPTFRDQVEPLRTLYAQYEKDVDFLTIYIREAHTSDQWQVKTNRENGIVYSQPTILEERLAIARDFSELFEFPLPMGLDAMDDRAMHAFGAWPVRAFILEDGAVVFQSTSGARGFRIHSIATWLANRFGQGG